MKTIIGTILTTILLLSGVLSTSDSVLQDTCTTPTERSKRFIQYFLTQEQEKYEKLREKSGTQNISIVELKNISDSAMCEKLNQIVEKHDNWNVDLKQNTKHYYQTDGFFFVIYVSKQIRLGITPLAIFDKEYNLIGMYGI